MQYTKISVSYQETANLGNYSNVKPFAEMEVVLESGDDCGEALAQAMATVRQLVQAQVDDALEVNEQSARYSAAPRYRILGRTQRTGATTADWIVIVPATVSKREYTNGFYARESGAFRLATAQRLAQAMLNEGRGSEIKDVSQDPAAWEAWARQQEQDEEEDEEEEEEDEDNPF